MKSWGVGVLSATGRKYPGCRRGTGHLYVRKARADRLPFLHLHAGIKTGRGAIGK